MTIKEHEKQWWDIYEKYESIMNSIKSERDEYLKKIDEEFFKGRASAKIGDTVSFLEPYVTDPEKTRISFMFVTGMHVCHADTVQDIGYSGYKLTQTGKPVRSKTDTNYICFEKQLISVNGRKIK